MATEVAAADGAVDGQRVGAPDAAVLADVEAERPDQAGVREDALDAARHLGHPSVREVRDEEPAVVADGEVVDAWLDLGQRLPGAGGDVDAGEPARAALAREQAPFGVELHRRGRGEVGDAPIERRGVEVVAPDLAGQHLREPQRAVGAHGERIGHGEVVGEHHRLALPGGVELEQAAAGTELVGEEPAAVVADRHPVDARQVVTQGAVAPVGPRADTVEFMGSVAKNVPSTPKAPSSGAWMPSPSAENASWAPLSTSMAVTCEPNTCVTIRRRRTGDGARPAWCPAPHTMPLAPHSGDGPVTVLSDHPGRPRAHRRRTPPIDSPRSRASRRRSRRCPAPTAAGCRAGRR